MVPVQQMICVIPFIADAKVWGVRLSAIAISTRSSNICSALRRTRVMARTGIFCSTNFPTVSWPTPPVAPATKTREANGVDVWDGVVSDIFDGMMDSVMEIVIANSKDGARFLLMLRLA